KKVFPAFSFLPRRGIAMRFFPLCLSLLLVLAPSLLAQPPAPPSPALHAWQLGQQAMDHDRFDEAIGQFQLSLRLDPRLARARLSLGAAHLALGEDRQAAAHLGRYLEARPDHFLIRFHYGELLARLNRSGE